MTIARANDIIDALLSQTSNRDLFSADEIQDAMLDLRNEINVDELVGAVDELVGADEP